MKLAEALAERKAAQEKIEQLNERLQSVMLVQEGEQPIEDPTVLLNELEEMALALEALMIAINRTNLGAALADGLNMTAALARRDVLRMRMGVVDACLKTATGQQFRVRNAEIKMLATVDVVQLRRGRDVLARQYRDLDTAIQAGNWATELIED